jgi:hypothetical protein
VEKALCTVLGGVFEAANDVPISSVATCKSITCTFNHSTLTVSTTRSVKVEWLKGSANYSQTLIIPSNMDLTLLRFPLPKSAADACKPLQVCYGAAVSRGVLSEPT